MIAIFPEIMTATETGDVEKVAILARKYFAGKGRFRPAPELNVLAESAGIAIERVPLEVHGILAAKDERGAITVAAFINKNLGPDEERFLLAHMLGHFFFDVMPMVARGEWKSSGFRESFSPLKRFSQNISYDQNNSVEIAKELLADRFAGALLMPVAMVIKATEKIQDPAKLAAFFQVTRPCLLRRLVDCGITGSLPVSFMDAEQRLIAEHKVTLGHDEPVKLTMPPPDASLIKAAASANYRSKNPAAAPMLKRPESKTPSAPAASLASMVADERKLRAAEAKAEAEPVTTDAGKGARGMDRIREIARKLDNRD